MMTNNKHSGTLRTDYQADHARLDDFPVMESDWYMLFHRLMKASNAFCYHDKDGREGTLNALLENHVLTVLADIARKKLSGYSDTFTSAEGTAGQNNYAEKLKRDIESWKKQLDVYLNNCWQTQDNNSPAIKVTRLLKSHLENASPDKDKNKKTDKTAYYRMLRTVTALQENMDCYLQQVEESGDTDPALSLLIAHLKNYSGVVNTFNNRLATLPELYRRNFLHAVPQKAVQDNAYIVITPTEGISGFTLPAGEPFPAGQNSAGEALIYRSVRKEYISPIQCDGINAVYLVRKEGKVTGIRKQLVPFRDVPTTETLFADRHSEALPLGWLVESPMLVLGEGERVVRIGFRITADEPSADTLSPHSFTLQLSNATGWTEQACTCLIDTSAGYRQLCFDFTISREAEALTPCAEEIHGMTTAYPALRILSDDTYCPYDQASRIRFNAVKIQINVNGIHNFTFCNELGEADTSQPFSPFGIQAEKGAWFFFGNEEMGIKPLQKVCLKGFWKKLPETETEFNRLYKSYTDASKTIDASSFTIATEWREARQWMRYENGEQPLFVPDKEENRSINCANIVFDLNWNTDGFFRVTLQAPGIGFGIDAYRTLFSETMIHNSLCKKKDCRELPVEPTIPILADAELSYIASEETTLTEIERSTIRLSRITALPEQDTCPITKKELPFLPTAPTDHLLYFSFVRAWGEQIIRFYLDLVLPKENVPFYNPQPDKSIKITWEYRDGNNWLPIPIESVIAEETSGLTQSGFVEIRLPQKISEAHIDRQGRTWLRAALSGEVSSCLAVRGIRTNCIRLEAQNGDGTPLPAGTIEGTNEADERIESAIQPMHGFGGRPAETETGVAVHQSSRIGNRHRAITMKDYEQLVLEHFPEVDKTQCIPIPQDKGVSEVCLVVFSHAEDSRYYLSPACKLAEIQRFIVQYASPFVRLRVVNPIYERVNILCKAILWPRVQDEGKALRQLVVLAQNYIAPWYRKREIPESGQHFSYKELHARMVNHEDLMKLVTLEVNGKSLPHVNIGTEDIIIRSNHPWCVLLPKIDIELLSPHDGIDEAEIGSNFIIG
ncbi:hypothetical protein ACGE0T_07015 [Parabacteroides sp. APC149_11_2_Y6]